MSDDEKSFDYPGLTHQEADKLLKRGGYNELPSQKNRRWYAILINVVREPMILLLLVSGLIYLFLGEVSDALMLVAGILLVIGITFYQEHKTERALDALKKLSSPRALVIRDSEQLRIPGSEVVVGDIMILREGDRIPADSLVLEANNFLVDESLLTGESLPINKDTDMSVFSGTLVIGGHAVVKAAFTGSKTQMGKIGKSLETIQDEETLITKETHQVITKFALFGFGLCFLVFLIYGLTRGNWLQGLLAGITLSMSMLPEEFTVVLMVFLALGAWRMSKHQVLTRNKAAVETLGACTALCVDKTGTITMNKIGLSGLWLEAGFTEIVPGVNLPENYHTLIEYASLASQADPFDPLEKAIRHSVIKLLTDKNHSHLNWKMIKEYPLSKDLLSISRVWQSPNSKTLEIAAKGAPEAIAHMCHFSPAKTHELASQIDVLARRGLRLIGVAKASFSSSRLPGNQHDFDFKFLGLLCFSDPVRPGVKEAVAECYEAGIRVIMITGDYPGTASFIASQIGLKNPENIITGAQLEKMDITSLSSALRSTSIFARVVPEQKLIIVNGLKNNGEIVAMTGDGVNDAPALKAANIGIAMGGRGTDVARESADLVLLDDDFSSIVKAVRMGRRIFDNLKKAMAYIFAVHVPIAGISLIPVIFRLPVVLFPAHIAFLQLIIDPACSLVFESETEEKNIMSRPPRKLTASLFSRNNLFFSITQGVVVLGVVLSVYFYFISHGKSADEIRTITFATMVFSNLLLIITNLSRTRHMLTILTGQNKSLYWILVATSSVLVLILSVPELRTLFHFSPLPFSQIFLAFWAGLVSILWFEGFKFYRRVVTKI